MDYFTKVGKNLSVMVFFFSVTMPTQAEDPYTCEIDQLLTTTNTLVDKAAINEIKKFMTPNKTKPSERACLPTLSKLGSSLSMTIPTMGDMSSAIFAKIRSAACAALDGAIENAAGELQASWEAPYGLGGVSTGATVDGSGLKTTTKEEDFTGGQDLIDEMGNKVTRSLSTNAKEATGSMNDDLNRIIGVDQANQKTEQTDDSWKKLKDQVTKGL